MHYGALLHTSGVRRGFLKKQLILRIYYDRK